MGFIVFLAQACFVAVARLSASFRHGEGEQGGRRRCQWALLTPETSMAEWWAAASWRKWLVVVMDMLFVVMVGAPLHCATAQLVPHAWWLLRRALRRALCDACRRRLPWSSSSWRASCCRAPSWPACAGAACLCGGLHVRAGCCRLSGLHAIRVQMQAPCIEPVLTHLLLPDKKK